MDANNVETKATEVLECSRILEDILLRMAPKKVLGLQRVSKFWKSTIEESIALQRKLFLKPVKQTEEWTAVLACEKIWAEDALFLVSAVQPRSNVDYISADTFVVSEHNPMIRMRRSRNRDYLLGFLCTAEHMNRCLLEDIECLHLSLPRLSSLWDASWLNMFLTQPPAQSVLVHEAHRLTGATQVHEWVNNPEGVTMKDVMKMLEQKVPYVRRVYKIDVHHWDRLFLDERWRGVIDEGVKKYEKLESKIGKEKAMKMRLGAGHSGKDLVRLLEGDNLDKIVAMGKVDAVLRGESIPAMLKEYEAMQRLPEGWAEGWWEGEQDSQSVQSKHRREASKW